MGWFILFSVGFVTDGDHDQKREMVTVQFHADGGNFSLLTPGAVRFSGGLYDKPLSCFGCGIGWFS